MVSLSSIFLPKLLNELPSSKEYTSLMSILIQSIPIATVISALLELMVMDQNEFVVMAIFVDKTEMICSIVTANRKTFSWSTFEQHVTAAT